jgi:hypothetical protein
MSAPHPFRTLFVPLAVAAVLLGLSGCGKEDPGAGASPDPGVSVTATASASPTPSDSPTVSESATTASPSTEPSATQPAGAPAPDALLLPASGMPGFNDGWSWRVRNTGDERGTVGVCERFPMRTIGADTTAMRTFVPAGDLTGGTGVHLVATFVDDTSVGQAMAVLRTWHDRCKERLSDYGFKKVGPVTSVPTSKGTATRYLTVYTKKGADEGTFDDLGVLRSGTTVELVLLRLRGQDYPQHDPMDKALQNAAHLLR